MDRYRVEREWTRYEGTGQRDLWRSLRERFLVRHATDAGWVLDLGSGPGRFTAALGGPHSRRVALDLSREMLRSLGEHWSSARGTPPLPERVRGDGLHPPFRPDTFGEVALLGNALGFAGRSADRLEELASSLVAPAGHLLLEVAPGPGECSHYFRRLPASTLGRLLRAPVGALVPRIEREGFRPLPYRRSPRDQFRRFQVKELTDRARQRGWEVEEVLAVAPVLGTQSERIDSVRGDSKAWEHLLAVEEHFGRLSSRWSEAAAVLLAFRRPAGIRSLK